MDWSYFFAKDAPFVAPYSWPHIAFLAAAALIVFLFIKNRGAIRKNRDKVVRAFLLVLLFQQMVLLYGWYAVATGFDPSVSLPLHICRVASLLTIVWLVTKRRVFLDIVCYFSVFALISLFYPKNVYHFAHMNGISYMVNHIVTVLIPIFGIVAYGWRPTWRSFRNAALAFLAYFAVALLLNALIPNANYFYQTDRPFWGAMPAPLFAALSAIGTLGGFAIITAVYNIAAKRIGKPASDAPGSN